MNKKAVEKIMNRLDVNEISNLLEYNAEINITQLKLYDFLIDIRGTHKFDQIIQSLKTKLSTSAALKYVGEIEIINSIFSECAKLQNAINIVPPQLVLPLMLYQGSYNVDEYISPEAKKFFKEHNADGLVSYEKHAEMTIKAIKSLMYNENLFDGDKFIHKFSNVQILDLDSKYKEQVRKYIEDSYTVSFWFEKYDYWKKGIYGISICDQNIFQLAILDKDLLAKDINPYIKERICRIQYEQQFIDEYFFRKSSKQSIRHIDVMEYISPKIVDKHFYCKSGDVLIQNVKIKDWLRAYFIIAKISQPGINQKVLTSVMSEFTLHIQCKTKEQWVKTFVKNGIPVQSANIIFDHLIFKKSSTDLYDYPFIPIDNKYLISCTISKLIHPAQSLISRFNSNDINIDIKGRNFEKNLYTFLELAKIPFVKLHNRINGNEYECDAVFYLNNTFVFCECKSRTGHEVETIDSSKYANDANQLSRISKFYRENMHLVFDAFETKGIRIKDKKFYDIKNIVIHSGSVDGVIIKDDVYIMDFDNFIIPFDRGFIFEDYINVKRLKNVFEGEVTIYKLFKFYNYNFCVYNYRNQFVYGNYDLRLGEILIHMEDYYVKDYFDGITKNESRLNMKRMLRYNGVSEGRIKELLDIYTKDW